jgi:hypothetical protein
MYFRIDPRTLRVLRARLPASKNFIPLQPVPLEHADTPTRFPLRCRFPGFFGDEKSDQDRGRMVAQSDL